MNNSRKQILNNVNSDFINMILSIVLLIISFIAFYVIGLYVLIGLIFLLFAATFTLVLEFKNSYRDFKNANK